MSDDFLTYKSIKKYVYGVFGFPMFQPGYSGEHQKKTSTVSHISIDRFEGLTFSGVYNSKNNYLEIFPPREAPCKVLGEIRSTLIHAINLILPGGDLLLKERGNARDQVCA